MWKVFMMSVLTMVLYRVIAAIKIWQITRIGASAATRVRRVVLQLLDLELYEILYLSHTMGLKGSSAPQRLLQVLEAIFEAAPQVILSLSFCVILIFRYEYQMKNGYSLFMLCIQLVLQSTYLLYAAHSGITPSYTITISTVLSLISLTATVATDDSVAFHGAFPMFFVYRIVDIPTKLCLYVLIWFGDLGYVTVINVGMNFVAAVLSFVVC